MIPLLLPLLSLAAAAAPSPSPWATAVPALVKVRPGTPLPVAPEISLHAARGECEGFQLATTRAAHAVRPSGLRLTREGGGDGALSARMYREGFLRLSTPSGPDGATGLWPDPLVPEEDAFVHEARDPGPLDATAARPLVFYVELCAPRTLAPGVYSGRLTLEAKDQPPASFPVRLRVDPFELPATSSLPNSFGLSLYSVAKGHGLSPESPQAHALLQRYATALLAHRITPYGLTFTPPPTVVKDGRASLDFTAYDRAFGPFFEGKVLPDGARFTSAGLIPDPRLKSEAERRAYERAWREHFAHKNWPAALFYYAKDEPVERDFPRVLAEGKRLHAVGGVSVLVTSPFEPALAPATDVYCPLLNCFFPQAGAATCRHPMTAAALRQRIPAWAHVWWYQSCMSHGCNGPKLPPGVARAFKGWASYMVDASGPRNRAMGPLAFLNGIDGELYFDTVYAFNGQDPWQSVYAFGGNGDGTLFYPGAPARIGGKTPIPVESLRLKTIRDGLEDYEYLRLARTLGLSQLAEASARALVPSGDRIVDDPAKWASVRDELARQITASWVRKYPAGSPVHP
jgi:hypothetical protein